MDCINSLGYGLFAVIKAIFSNSSDLELIMNYVQTIVSINIRLNRYGDRIQTCNLHDTVQTIHPLYYEYLIMCIYSLEYKTDFPKLSEVLVALFLSINLLDCNWLLLLNLVWTSKKISALVKIVYNSLQEGIEKKVRKYTRISCMR